MDMQNFFKDFSCNIYKLYSEPQKAQLTYSGGGSSSSSIIIVISCFHSFYYYIDLPFVENPVYTKHSNGTMNERLQSLSHKHTCQDCVLLVHV